MNKKNTLNVILFGSGQGTLINAVCMAKEIDILKININCIVSNNKNNNLLDIGKNYEIPVETIIWNKDIELREQYDDRLINITKKYKNDLIVLAGWMHIVNNSFIYSFKNIINIHPALPDTFIGVNCIKKAYDAFQKGEIKYTGSTIHKVTSILDRGEIIDTIDIPIYNHDTYEDLENRQKFHERGLLVNSIQKYVQKYNTDLLKDDKIYIGKVRSVKDIGYNLLLLTASERLSAFDKNICDIINKGNVLNKMSTWWFNNTKHIIKNHFIYSNTKYMIVKKAEPIKLEFIVRGYMTGSTNTSIWTMYNRGERNMYGLIFRDGYKKNEQLDNIILTPTTKGITDKPITRNQIIDESYLTTDEYIFIEQKCFELFKYGQEQAKQRRLILVDTKYEFGKINDEIILIDELHTCDSSRYWIDSTYKECMEQCVEPHKKDKDVIRDWIKNNCDPYKDEIPEIPCNLIKQVENVYDEYINIFSNTNNIIVNGHYYMDEEYIINDYFNNIDQLVIIISGSVSDQPHNLKIQKCLKEQNIYSKIFNCSAHTDTRGVLKIIDNLFFVKLSSF